VSLLVCVCVCGMDGCLRWANSGATCERLLAHPSCNGAVVRLQANLEAHDRFAAAACMTAIRYLAAHPMGRRRLLDPKQVRRGWCTRAAPRNTHEAHCHR
jgi:hypothetical protein